MDSEVSEEDNGYVPSFDLRTRASTISIVGRLNGGRALSGPPRLSADWEGKAAAAEAAARDPLRENSVIVRYETANHGFYSIQGCRMAELLPRAWAGDEVIDAWCHLHRENNFRKVGWTRAADPTPKVDVMVFTTKFYERLVQVRPNGSLGGYIFENVESWTKPNLIRCHLGDCKSVLFPVHLPNHWVQVEVCLDPARFGIRTYDSFNHDHPDLIEIFARWVEEEAKGSDVYNKRPFHVPPRAQWHVGKAIMPQQRDGFNCGIFVCAIVDWICRGKQLPLSWDGSERFLLMWRRRIAASFMAKTVDDAQAARAP